MIALVLSLMLLMQPGEMGQSHAYCDDVEAAKKIIDLDLPKVIPDNVACYFTFPEFTFSVVRVVQKYKSAYIIEVSNPYNDAERRFVLQFVKGEDA